MKRFLFAISMTCICSLTHADSPGFEDVSAIGRTVTRTPVPRPNPRRAQAQTARSQGASLDLENMPQASEIIAGPPPQAADLMIRFNQKVVRSFTDHMLQTDLDRGLLRDVLFRMEDGKMRISAIADFASLDKIIPDDLTDYVQADYQGRISNGETFCLVLDAVMDVSTMEGRLNEVFFTWRRQDMNVYGIWANSREEHALRGYIESSGVESGVDERRAEIETAQNRIDELEGKASLSEAEETELLRLLRQLRSQQTLEVARIPIQIGEEPMQRVIHELIQAAGSENVAATGLKIGHRFTEGSHVMGFGGLNGVFQAHLPEFQVVHTDIEDQVLVFAGRLAQ